MTNATETTSSGFDLDSLINSAEATSRVGVAFNDDGDATSGFIIVGKDSDAYRACEQRQQNAGIKRGATKSQRIDGKTDEGAATIGRLMATNMNELAFSVVIDWFGFTKAGAHVAFTADGLSKVFESRPTWRDKVLAALENEDNFLPISSPTSVNMPDSSSV